MNTTRLAARSAALLCLLLAACSSTKSSTVEPCEPGEAVSCKASSGCSGFKTCRESGRGFDPCLCDDAGASGGSAGTAGSGGSAGDGGTGGAQMAGAGGAGGNSGAGAEGGSAGGAGMAGAGGSAGDAGAGGSAGAAGAGGSGAAGAGGSAGASGAAGNGGTSGTAGTAGNAGTGAVAGTGGSSGGLGSLGAPCVSTAACESPLVCWAETDPNGGPPNGMCTIACDTGQCPSGASCLTFVTAAAPLQYCVPQCTPSGGFFSNKCGGRRDQACDARTGGVGVCRPICSQSLDCLSSGLCNVRTNLCGTQSGGSSVVGTSCDPGNDSCAGQCQGRSTTCEERCVYGTDGCGPTADCYFLFNGSVGTGDLGACARSCSSQSDCAGTPFVCQSSYCQ